MPDGAPGDPAAVKVPLLKSPALERRWGRPALKVKADGSYELTYQNPARSFQMLSIYGAPGSFPRAGATPPNLADLDYDPATKQMVPVSRPQQWQTITIAGQAVRYYVAQPDSGADPARMRTETFTLTAPDGRTASYLLEADSDTEAAGSSHQDLMRTASF